MKRAFLHLYFKAGRSFNEVRLFGEGLKRHGWEVYAGDHTQFTGTDLIVQWNIRNGELVKRVLADGGEACILETSYIEPRKEYCSVGFGYGVNKRLRHYGPFTDDRRWQARFADRLKPWREPVSGPVLIMGQTPGDMALKSHVNFFDWVARVYNELTKLGHDVRYRPHPNTGPHLLKRHGQRAKKWQRVCVHADEEQLYRGLHLALDEGMKIEATKTLEQALNEAGHVVTFNSNSGVDAVLHGVPAITMDEGAMAWDVAGHKLGEIVRPDRERWAHWLSWCQWTPDELESGVCWEHAAPPHMR